MPDETISTPIWLVHSICYRRLRINKRIEKTSSKQASNFLYLWLVGRRGEYLTARFRVITSPIYCSQHPHIDKTMAWNYQSNSIGKTKPSKKNYTKGLNSNTDSFIRDGPNENWADTNMRWSKWQLRAKCMFFWLYIEADWPCNRV